MGLLRAGLDRSKFPRGNEPDQENGDKADEDGKNKSPEVILGLVKDVSSQPRPDRGTYTNISFDHAIDEAKIFPLIKISRNRHEHRSSGPPSCAEEECEKIEKKSGGDVLKEKESQNSEGEADAPQSVGNFSADPVREPSPEESKPSRDRAHNGKKRGSPHPTDSKVHQISHVMNNDDVDPEYDEGRKEDDRPEASCLH